MSSVRREIEILPIHEERQCGEDVEFILVAIGEGFIDVLILLHEIVPGNDHRWPVRLSFHFNLILEAFDLNLALIETHASRRTFGCWKED